jgi:ferredoxin
MVRRLAEFLGPELFSARITLAEEETDAPYEPQGYSRREMMSHLTQTSKLGTRQLLRMLPGMEDEQRGHALDHRLMLNQRIKQLKAGAETPLHYGFYLPTVTDACYGCGKCERACRAGALKLMENDDGFTRLVVTPWKCSECGQCVSACTDKAMPELTLRQITTLGPVSVHKLKVELCPECGKPMIPGSEEGICKVCLSRRKMKQRREEAAARAKERAEERKREQEEKAAAEAAAALAAGTAAADAAPAPAENPAAPEQAVSAALPAQEGNAEAAPKAAPAESPAAPEAQA